MWVKIPGILWKLSLWSVDDTCIDTWLDFFVSHVSLDPYIVWNLLLRSVYDTWIDP